MNILIASDKFKGSLKSLEVAEALSNGIHAVNPTHAISTYTLADGGDGSLEVLSQAYDCKLVEIEVQNAAYQPIKALIGFNTETKVAVLEMAAYSGLAQLPEHLRNPLQTSSVGLGEAVKEAVRLGAQTIVIGLGGSATNDGGAGMLSALGFRFLDAQGNQVKPAGGNLDQIVQIDYPPEEDRLENVAIMLATDVNNPICGTNGATHTYGEQKGASLHDLKVLETNMYHFATRIEEMTGNRVFNIEGYGAAGGIPLGACELLSASLKSGSELIFEILELDEKIKQADLVITGEGKIDEQTAQGKAIGPVVQTAIQYDKELILVCGAFGAFDDRVLSAQTRYELTEVAHELNLDSFSGARELCMEIGKKIAIRLEQEGDKV